MIQIWGSVMIDTRIRLEIENYLGGYIIGKIKKDNWSDEGMQGTITYSPPQYLNQTSQGLN